MEAAAAESMASGTELSWLDYDENELNLALPGAGAGGECGRRSRAQKETRREGSRRPSRSGSEEGGDARRSCAGAWSRGKNSPSVLGRGMVSRKELAVVASRMEKSGTKASWLSTRTVHNGRRGLKNAKKNSKTTSTYSSLDPFSYPLFSSTESCFFLADDAISPPPTMIRGDLPSSLSASSHQDASICNQPGNNIAGFRFSTSIIKHSPTIARILLQKKSICLVQGHPQGSSKIHLQEAFGPTAFSRPTFHDRFISHGGEFYCCINNTGQQGAVNEEYLHSQSYSSRCHSVNQELVMSVPQMPGYPSSCSYAALPVRPSSPKMEAVPPTSSLNSGASGKTLHHGKPILTDGKTNLKRHLEVEVMNILQVCDSNGRADWADKDGTTLEDHFVDLPPTCAHIYPGSSFTVLPELGTLPLPSFFFLGKDKSASQTVDDAISPPNMIRGDSPSSLSASSRQYASIRNQPGNNIAGFRFSTGIIKHSPTIAGILLQKKSICLVQGHPQGSSKIHLQEAFGQTRDGRPNQDGRPTAFSRPTFHDRFISHGGEFLYCCINNNGQQGAVNEENLHSQSYSSWCHSVKQELVISVPQMPGYPSSCSYATLPVRPSSPKMGAVPPTSSLNSGASGKTLHDGKPILTDGKTNLKRHLEVELMSILQVCDSNGRADWADKDSTTLGDHFVDVIIYTLDFIWFLFLPNLSIICWVQM